MGEEKTEGLCLDEIARKRVSKVKKLTFMIFNMLWYYVMKGEAPLRYIISYTYVSKTMLLYLHLEFAGYSIWYLVQMVT